MKRIALLLVAVGCCHALRAAEPPAAARYTFSWPLDASAPKPRGGATRGPAVSLDTGESAAWRSLHDTGLSPFERDRRAILAMAGDYRVTFDFLEVAAFKPGAARDRPYQSWGTERVFVERDEGAFISLVHILDMRVIQEDGSLSEPIVTKHWRQDWQYEPRQLIEFKGRNRWERRELSRGERKDQWSQTVDQVDESPRYASVGRWEHSSSLSTWISGSTWRPLPRREWSVRQDYQVLAGTNRVTLTASGWLQEENNLKTVLTEERGLDASQPYLAREYGVARYERLRDADFAAAREYFERTRRFWHDVHSAWDDVFRRHAQITLRAPVDQAGLFEKLFAYADQLAHGGVPDMPEAQVIDESMRDMGAPVPVDAPKAAASGRPPAATPQR